MKKLISVSLLLTTIISINAQLDSIECGITTGQELADEFNTVVKILYEIDSAKVVDDTLRFYVDGSPYTPGTLSTTFNLTEYEADMAEIQEVIQYDEKRIEWPGYNPAIWSMFVGFRSNGDSIFLEGFGSAMNANNQMLRGYNFAGGNNSIAEGYQTVSIGTNTISGGNDAIATGNETMTGHRLYIRERLSIGYDTSNYIDIYGGEVETSQGFQPAIGDQSDYFFSAVDSGALPYTSRVFWDYPFFWINSATRDYPIETKVGHTPLYCTGVTYNSSTNTTRVWYTDSIASLGVTTWVTDCRKNFLVGTGQSTHGKYVSAYGEQSFGAGIYGMPWAAFATHTGKLGLVQAQSGFHQGYGGVVKSTALNGAHFGRRGTVSGQEAVHFGRENDAATSGSAVFGYRSKAYDNYDLVFASGNFTDGTDTIGNGQGEKFIDILVTIGVGPFTIDLKTIKENTSYHGHSIIGALQTSTSTGRKGEAGSWTIDWGFSVNEKIVVDSVDIDRDRLYYTGDTLYEGDSLAYNSYTDTTMNAGGTAIGGMSPNFRFYVDSCDYDGAARYITVKTSPSGSKLNLTTKQEAYYHVFYRYSTISNLTTLLGRSFLNDGDDIGNGTTTGIRPYVNYYITYHKIRLYMYGLNDRTIRWVSNSDMTRIKTE